ncbi:MAG: hypothetical protein M1546_15080 [Chloroflexi bacterium]|nr:hypothetical protein [Chloroflexota bacterium]
MSRDGHWGVMTTARWQAFLDWICEQHLLKDSLGQDVVCDSLDVSAMFTNQFL